MRSNFKYTPDDSREERNPAAEEAISCGIERSIEGEDSGAKHPHSKENDCECSLDGAKSLAKDESKNG